MQKLTNYEKRAKAYCQELIDNNGGTIVIEWKRSAMYGSNPRINFRGEKCCNISGCGYDKESACLADVLRFLFPESTDEHQIIWGCSGAGFSSIRNKLESLNWTIKTTFSNKTTDVYTLERKV